MWQWLRDETDFFGKQGLKVLHIAPERCFSRRFAKMLGANYVTADLESPLADVMIDVQQMPFGDEDFDVVFCNHVLEHVPDDRRALREIFRVMKNGGWGVVMSPVDLSREKTFEDPAATTPALRAASHGQHDHLRIYGADYLHRLSEAGFSVEFMEPEIYVVRK